VSPACRGKNERPSEAVILRIHGKAGGDLSAEASAKVGVSPSKKNLIEDGRREMGDGRWEMGDGRMTKNIIKHVLI
jgi:hypothetical protein